LGSSKKQRAVGIIRTKSYYSIMQTPYDQVFKARKS